MPPVLFKCPRSGAILNLPIDLTPHEFANSEFKNNVIGCPECGESHPFTKNDLWLAGHEPPESPFIKG